MKTRRLALLGASGHAKVVADAAFASGWQSVEFFDDRWPQDQSMDGRSIVGDTQTLLAELDRFQGVIVSIGDSRARWAKQEILAAAGASLITVVHPSAWISPSASIGLGTVVMAGCVVQADAVVGDACIVNTCSSIDHDCQVGNAVHVAPGARLSGNVEVGEHSWIGLGACIRQGIKVGRDVIVGAGAVVVKDHGNGGTLMGCPARLVP